MKKKNNYEWLERATSAKIEDLTDAEKSELNQDILRDCPTLLYTYVRGKMGMTAKKTDKRYLQYIKTHLSELLKIKSALIIAHKRNIDAKIAQIENAAKAKWKFEASIDGLAEYRKLADEWNDYYRKIDRQFNRESGLAFLPAKPAKSTAEVIAAHPKLKIYLHAEKLAEGANHELNRIGKEAIEKLKNGEDFDDVNAWMDEQNNAFCERHAWD